jgi:hypothetical protein
MRNYDDTRGFGYNIQQLRRDADFFTATARLYYSQGGFALVSGFFMQFVAELAKINPLWSVYTFLVGGAALVYIGYSLTN